jgi:dTMP kinase
MGMPAQLFVAFEGGEGSGKSSQIRLLAESLRAEGRQVTLTYEPGSTTVGKLIRQLLLETDEQIAPRSEALLFAADRAHHVHAVIRPQLAAGHIVLTDRYLDSSIAYQGAGRTLATEDIARISRWATEELRPDLTVLLDIDPAVGLARVHRREADGFDRLEREALEFHQRVREGFLQLARQDPQRYLVLDATGPVGGLAAEILDAVRGRLAG